GFGCVSPCVVFGAVESRTLALGEDIEKILAAPGVGVRVILVGAHAPIGGLGHGIGGNGAKETDLFILHLHTVDEGLEIGRIAEAVCFHLNASAVGGIFVPVDRVAHLPQIAVEFALFL